MVVKKWREIMWGRVTAFFIPWICWLMEGYFWASEGIYIFSNDQRKKKGTLEI